MRRADNRLRGGGAIVRTDRRGPLLCRHTSRVVCDVWSAGAIVGEMRGPREGREDVATQTLELPA